MLNKYSHKSLGIKDKIISTSLLISRRRKHPSTGIIFPFICAIIYLFEDPQRIINPQNFDEKLFYNQ